jgi:predicted esterase
MVVGFLDNNIPANKGGYSIAPGQTRVLTFTIGALNRVVDTLSLEIEYRNQNYGGSGRVLKTQPKFRRVGLQDLQKITYTHPSGMVSYAMMRPPSQAACPDGSTSAPIILLLHGAGVDVDSSMTRDVSKTLPDMCAWQLYPSGVTTWCGDDWHIWGQRDVRAAKEAVAQWIKDVGWSGVGVDTGKLLVVGHSNGGQGVWHMLTHEPGDILAAAPASGYLSIPLYVPSTFWRPMDSRKRAVIEAASSSYRPDLLAPNFKGITVYQQHGSIDDNVPAYHSRFMHEIIGLTGVSSNYTELKGKGHWFDGIMTTDGLKRFYSEQLLDPKKPSLEELVSFDLIVPNPADISGRFGLVPLYVEEPGRLGKLSVTYGFKQIPTEIEVENMMAFKLEGNSNFGPVSIIDANSEQDASFAEASGTRVFRKDNGKWIEVRCRLLQ